MRTTCTFILLLLASGCAAKKAAPASNIPALMPPASVSRTLVVTPRPSAPAFTNITLVWIPDNSVPGEVSVIVSNPSLCKPDTNWIEVFRGPKNTCTLPIDFSVPAKFFAAYSDFEKTNAP
jgi:hypothetical protein